MTYFKPILTLFFVLGLSVLTCAQNDTLNQVDKNGLKQGYWIIYGRDKPDKGYPEDGKIEEGNYIDNRKNGV